MLAFSPTSSSPPVLTYDGAARRRLESYPPVSKPGRPTKLPATVGAPSTTFSGRAGSRRGAGPFRTRALSLRSNSEKWHGHLIVLDAGCQSQTSHPVCVHTAEYATIPSAARARVSPSSRLGSRRTTRIWLSRESSRITLAVGSIG